MSEMVERVAKAIRESYIGRPMIELINTEDLARAAIEAMREPTLDMIESGNIEDYDGKACWDAMISAALRKVDA